MEPRREEPKVGQPGLKQKPKRFRVVRLEDRIVPGGATNAGNWPTIALGGCGTLKHCK